MITWIILAVTAVIWVGWTHHEFIRKHIYFTIEDYELFRDAGETDAVMQRLLFWGKLAASLTIFVVGRAAWRFIVLVVIVWVLSILSRLS